MVSSVSIGKAKLSLKKKKILRNGIDLYIIMKRNLGFPPPLLYIFESFYSFFKRSVRIFSLSLKFSNFFKTMPIKVSYDSCLVNPLKLWVQFFSSGKFSSMTSLYLPSPSFIFFISILQWLLLHTHEVSSVHPESLFCFLPNFDGFVISVLEFERFLPLDLLG